VVAQQAREVNYIRNSVKATVDAYDGSVDLYAWDEDDPVLEAWRSVFPDAVQPLSAIEGDLMAHLRYPEDLFKVQRSVLANYHVDQADSFYTEEAFWQVPNDPTAAADTEGVGAGGADQPPYYLTLQMPGQDRATFSLTSTFVPGSGEQGQATRNVLTGFLAVDADAGSTTGEKAEGYGRLRLLELPSDTTVAGPAQVYNNFLAETEVSTTLNLLRAGGSTEVINGNLLTLPVGGGLLYVQPVYVQGSSGAVVPRLQRVLVSFGNEIGFAETLDEALDQVFDGNSGIDTVEVSGQAPAPPETPAPPATPGTPPATPAPGTPAPPAGSDLQTALNDANQALQDGQAALARGDFAGYGEAQTRLQEALGRAIAAEQAAGGAAATPSGEPAPTGG
jgi:hypothetical protein